jgi:hypothetical protein
MSTLPGNHSGGWTIGVLRQDSNYRSGLAGSSYALVCFDEDGVEQSDDRDAPGGRFNSDVGEGQAAARRRLRELIEDCSYARLR